MYFKNKISSVSFFIFNLFKLCNKTSLVNQTSIILYFILILCNFCIIISFFNYITMLGTFYYHIRSFPFCSFLSSFDLCIHIVIQRTLHSTLATFETNLFYTVFLTTLYNIIQLLKISANCLIFFYVCISISDFWSLKSVGKFVNVSIPNLTV